MSPSLKRSLLLDAETLVWFFAIYVFFTALPADVYASNSIKDTICKVANIFQGQAGRNVASLAIIIVGFGALMGKVSAGLCVIVCVGIALIFGSAPIVQALTGQTGCGGNATCVGNSTTELEEVVRRAIQMITGRIGKAIAILAVIIVGVGALYGKVSWPLAVIVGLGVALIFGSFTVLKQILGCTTIQNENNLII